jgi:hypothetical protein
MLPMEAALERLALKHGPDPCSPANSSSSGDSCLGMDPYARLFIHNVKIIKGIPVVTAILQSSAGALSLSLSAESPDHHSADDYPEIGGSIYWNYSKEGHLIYIVAPNEDPSRNNSSRYPTIGRSEASDARIPNAGVV